MGTFKTLLVFIFFAMLGAGFTAAPASAQGTLSACKGLGRDAVTGEYTDEQKLVPLPMQECVTPQRELRCTTEIRGQLGVVHPQWINSEPCQRAVMVARNGGPRGPQGHGIQQSPPQGNLLGDMAVAYAHGRGIADGQHRPPPPRSPQPRSCTDRYGHRWDCN